jgi:phosphate transport system ATP-binding protein
VGRGGYPHGGGVAAIDRRANIVESATEADRVRTLDASDLSAWFGRKQVLREVNMGAEPGSVTAIIGPSGCGKSTLIRCLNRMHEETRGARVEGKVLFDGQDIYAPDSDPVDIRRRIGMVFQRPNPFPTMSIFDNAVAGLRLGGKLPKKELAGRAEQALTAAGLWGEVKDRLQEPGGRLSGGNWLSLDHTDGTVTTPYTDVSQVNVNIDPKGLPAGDYYGQVQVSAPGAPKAYMAFGLIS